MKNLIRVIVLVALLAWPAVEIYRLQDAKKQLAESELLGQSISQKLASLKKLRDVARTEASAPQNLPISESATPTPSPDQESQ